MSISRVRKGEIVVVGLLVEAHFSALSREVPVAWQALFARQVELTPACGPLAPFVELSIGGGDGNYRELVGVQVLHTLLAVPPGMVRASVPANDYLNLEHDGPLVGIAQGFDRLLTHAAEMRAAVSDLKLDFGYAPGLPAGRHELFVGLEPFSPPVFG